jgi:hypothetical protein
LEERVGGGLRQDYSGRTYFLCKRRRDFIISSLGTNGEQVDKR